jgi:hypothetical protein
VVLKGLPNLSNLEFPGFTLLVFRAFIFYNAPKIAQVGAQIPISNPKPALSGSVQSRRWRDVDSAPQKLSVGRLVKIST